MAKYKIPEIRYRASRICQVMGNPITYEILHFLKKEKKTPEQLAHILGVSIPAVSKILRSLRELDLVRYEVLWRKRNYWIKTNMVAKVMLTLEQLVTITTTVK